MLAIYVIAMIATCWHFAYGIWLFAAKWGITPGDRARKRFGYVCGAVGAALALMGLISIYAVVYKYPNAPEDVMPPQVGGFHREKMDQRAALSGTVNLIYHAAYVPVAKSVTIDVYATTLDRSAAELDRFRDVVQLAAMAGSGQRSVTEVSAKPFLYEIVGVPGTPGVNAAFQQALTSQVGGR